jgi:anti-anti-sigma regulatory factor
MSTAGYAIATKVCGRTIVISVDGRLDRSAPSAAEIAKLAVEKGARIAILDLSRAELINSDGLDWLDEIRAILNANRIKLRLVAKEGGKVNRILRLMQYDKVVTLLTSLRDALRAGKRRTMRPLSRKKRQEAAVAPLVPEAKPQTAQARSTKPPMAGVGGAKP